MPYEHSRATRFSNEQAADLKRLSDALGVDEVTIIRWAVEALADYFKHHGGRLLLPLRFYESFSIITLPQNRKLILHEPPRGKRESNHVGVSSKK